MKNWWKSIKSDWDITVLCTAISAYSFMYAVIALVFPEKLGEAIEPLTGLAIAYSIVLVIVSILKMVSLYSLKNRLRGFTSLAMFFIWTTTGLIYLHQGQYYLFATITAVPIYISVYLSLRNNTAVFDKKS